MKINILILLLTSFSTFYANNSLKAELFTTLFNYKGPRTFLVSYPKSGNTFMRYCIEFLTGRPTFYRVDGFRSDRDRPLGLTCNFDLDLNKPPIEKIHLRQDMNYRFLRSNPLVDKIILLIRNPKEAITRTEAREISLEMLQSNEGIYPSWSYFDALFLYDDWPAENRLLIYYEDFINDPRNTLIKILEFLDERPSKLKTLLQNYEKHQEMALEVYRESQSQGKDLLFHSRKSSPEYRKQIDQWIEELYPILWNKYLKKRYREEVLQY